jgi:HTH-type transcriptional regulator, sugar sensing transcriptional regulator
MSTLSEQLKQSGLLESEIGVYLFLLEQGISSPPQIAKGTKIARPNLYPTLRTLKEKGLVNEQQSGKRCIYAAADPSVLVHRLESRAQAMKQVLPDLRALYSAQKNKPTVKFFEGAEQVKEIFYEMLEAKEVYGVASTKKLYDALGWEFFGSYILKMRERGIFLKDILTQDSIDTSAPNPITILKGMYDTRLLPKSIEHLPVDILVWDDKIALISTEQPIFGTLIQNPAIAQVMKIMFDLSWKQLS